MVTHIHEFGEDRERQAIRRLFLDDSASGFLARVLGIPSAHWIGINIPSDRLGHPRGSKPGDIDVCCGPLVPTSRQALEAAFEEADKK